MGRSNRRILTPSSFLRYFSLRRPSSSLCVPTPFCLSSLSLSLSLFHYLSFSIGSFVRLFFFARFTTMPSQPRPDAIRFGSRETRNAPVVSDAAPDKSDRLPRRRNTSVFLAPASLFYRRPRHRESATNESRRAKKGTRRRLTDQ